MSAQHTPGPWEVRRAIAPDNTGGYDWAVVSKGRVIAEAFENVGYVPDDGLRYDSQPVEANARLIAAAPELLETIRELWTYTLGLQSIIRDGVYRSEELNDPKAWDCCDDWAYNGEGASMCDQVESLLAKIGGQS